MSTQDIPQDAEFEDDYGDDDPSPGAALDHRIQQAEEVLQDLNQRAMTFVREHPGVCIAGAFALGYLVGRAASRRWLR